MNKPGPDQQQELYEILDSLRTRVGRLTVAVVLMVMAVFLLTATVLGDLVNWFALEPALFGGASVGAALVGFGFGWFAGRRA